MCTLQEAYNVGHGLDTKKISFMLTVEEQHRELIAKAKRIVVKVGTRILVDKNARPNRRRIAAIAKQLSDLRKSGKEVVLVSSGAIATGLHTLGMKRRPKQLSDLQMAAAVGQTQLLDIYNTFFSKARCQISQVLLTHADLKHRGRHLNARNTMLKLLQHGIIPIVNENDVVSVDEIRVGDNDILSSLVAVLIDADALIILTTPDGLRRSTSGRSTQRVSYLPSVTPQSLQLVTKAIDALSTGGMITKLKAAQMAAKVGAMVVIASGQKSDTIERIMRGDDVGTLIGNKAQDNKLDKRKQWITYFHRSQGALVVDKGAVDALQKRGKSLLPIGVKAVKGQFPVGAMIDIVNEKKQVIAHGLVEYSSLQIDKIKGRESSDIESILGFKDNDVVIHRNNLVMLA